MSSSSYLDEPIGVTDSGLEVTPRFIQGLRDVGMEALATYYAPSCDEDAIARAIEELVLH